MVMASKPFFSEITGLIDQGNYIPVIYLGSKPILSLVFLWVFGLLSGILTTKILFLCAQEAKTD